MAIISFKLYMVPVLGPLLGSVKVLWLPVVPALSRLYRSARVVVKVIVWPGTGLPFIVWAVAEMVLVVAPLAGIEVGAAERVNEARAVGSAAMTTPSN
jgi:hypothetical protein